VRSPTTTAVALALLLGCSSAKEAAPTPSADAGDTPTGIRTCARKPRVTAIPTTCNGSTALCDRTFDRVTFPMTHNAMSNADEKYAAPNQNHGVARQLADGIRGLMLDTHYYSVDDDKTLDAPMPGVAAIDQAYLCHGICQLGRKRLLDGLCDITDFLDQNRGEVLTIIFESYVTEADMVSVLQAAGLSDYVFTYDGKSFPTLRDMIAKDQRLFVTVEDGGGTPAWYQHAWSIIQDTPYTFAKASEFTCADNRGSKSDPLFLVNHWIGDPLANPARATEVNAHDVLLGRMKQCATERGKRVNFVGVDFYDLGDLFKVVDELNAE
jgi:hypothetical protein